MLRRGNVEFLLFLACFAPALDAQPVPFVERSNAAQVSGSAMLVARPHPELFLVLSAKNTLKLLDAATLVQRASMSAGDQAVSALVISGDAKRIFASDREGHVQAWSVEGGALLYDVEPHSRSIVGLALLADTVLLSATERGEFAVSHATTGRKVGSLPSAGEEITCLATTPDGKLCAAGAASGAVHVYDIAKSEEIRILGHAARGIHAIAFSADAATLAAGTIDGDVFLWDAHTWTSLGRISGTLRSVTSLGFDPKNRWLVVASADSQIHFYALPTRQHVKAVAEPGSYATFVSFVNDGVLCAATNKGWLTTWRVLDAPPDTNPPVIVMIQPDKPVVKAYGSEYEIAGYVCDDSLVKGVTVNGLPVAFRTPERYDALRLPPGMKVMEFRHPLLLDSAQVTDVEIKAVDMMGNTAAYALKVQKVSKDQALEIMSPAAESETNRISARLQFRTWFPAASYSVFANLTPIVENKSMPQTRPGESVTEEIPLIVGYNRVQVVAATARGEKLAKTVGVTRRLGPGTPEAEVDLSPRGANPQRWAVVVGVSEFVDPAIPPLKFADVDAHAMAAFLRSPEGGGFEEDHIRVLVNKDATLGAVRDALINFLSQAIDMDFVLIYFAGHGLPEPARPSNLYLLTYDSDPGVLGTTAFPMWQIQDVLARYITAKRIVVFSDACHSGGISVSYNTRGLNIVKTNPINQYLTDLSRSKEGVVVFTASSAGEVSQEFPELGHGVFTYYLLEGLKGKADFDNNYTVTINELMRYVEDQVKRKTKGTQNPTRSQTTYDKSLTISVVPH